MKIIWIIGGPGCGKGTQCNNMIEKYGFAHLSSGDLLREEIASGSTRGAELKDIMAKGMFVSTEIVLSLLKEKIDKLKAENPDIKGILIDGYPREVEQGIEFEKTVGPVDLIIFFDVADDTLIKRLLGRAAASVVKRDDDNEDVIKRRIDIFNEKNGKIVEHYKSKVKQINAEGEVSAIFQQVSEAIDRVLSA